MSKKLSLALSLCFLCSGCTLIGAGTGAAVDAARPGPYEIHSPSASVRLERDDCVKLWLANGESIQGHYLGMHGPTPRDPESYLVIDEEPKPRLVPVSQVKTLGVEVSGKGWMYGALIGLAVDVMVLTAAIIAVSDDQWMGDWNMNGESGCFC
jgi:hypothetical protein